MNKKNIESPKLYAVIPVYNEEKLIESFLCELATKLSQLTPNYTIVAIDDGSNDESKRIIQFLSDNLNIKLISFSRNFGKEAALTAGIEASGEADAVIIMDSDFQHPFEVLDQFYEKWREGFLNVYGIRNRTDQSLVKSVLSKTFYDFSKKIMKINIPADAGDFRLLDRQVVKAINMLPEKNRFMKGLYAWVGFKGCPVKFEVNERADNTASRWGYGKLFSLALTGILSFSSVPLRIISLFGIIISLFAMGYGSYIFIKNIFFDVNVSGWPTIVVSIMFFSGVQLISLGVLGEYISRIFDEAKNRPKYIIDDEESRNLD